MKNFKHGFVAVLPILLIGFGARAEWASFDAKQLVDGKRLVQTSKTERSWLTQDQMDALSEVAHKAGKCGSYMDVTDQPETPRFYRAPLKLMEARLPRQQAIVVPLLKEMSAANLFSSVTKLSSFNTRFYQSDTGAQAALWIRDQFVALARGRTDITVEVVQHNFKMPSVIARIAGSGRLAPQSIVLGAHADSISGRGSATARAPGADDDASGVATLLETFRVIAQSGFRPQRTIEFMAYAGEEAGLLGSRAIAAAYAKQKRDVVAVMQFDMVAYPSRSKKITFITDHVNKLLTEFSMKLVEEYVRMPYTVAKCGYACSDHASWDQAGYAAAFPFESPFNEHNSAIHTANDTLQNDLDMEYGLHFAKLGLSFAIEISRD